MRPRGNAVAIAFRCKPGTELTMQEQTYARRSATAGMARCRAPSTQALAFALTVILGVGPVLAATAIPPESTLEAQGVTIREIRINARPIYDESVAGERTSLMRFANRIHVDTHEEVIRAQLLFKSGDRYSARVLRETERNLRKLRFLREPVITVVAVHSGQVDIEVRTIDVWTLSPTFEFSRNGGDNRTSIGIQDFNFLGYGKTLELSHKSDRDRSSNVLAYNDPNLAYSRWKLDLAFSNNSDGHDHRVAIERPFFALDTENSYGLSLRDTDELARRYALGDEVDIYRRRQSTMDAFVGRSQGLIEGWSQRHTVGLRRDDSRFDLHPPGPSAAAAPDDRDLAYPYYRFEAIEDDFGTTTNRDVIGRTEDEAYGRRYLLELGYASRSLGSNRDAALIRAELADGYHLSARQSAFASAAFSARLEGGQWVDSLLATQVRYFFRHSQRSVFYAGLSADVGNRLDADHDLLLGGDNGMRAYPIAFQSGEKRALLTLEQRYFTDWQVYRTFTVGAAVFADIGRVWGPNSIDAPLLGTVKDFGIGLRFGNLRSARANVLHVDLAWPVDDPINSGPQLMVETRSTF